MKCEMAGHIVVNKLYVFVNESDIHFRSNHSRFVENRKKNKRRLKTRYRCRAVSAVPHAQKLRFMSTTGSVRINLRQPPLTKKQKQEQHNENKRYSAESYKADFFYRRREKMTAGEWQPHPSLSHSHAALRRDSDTGHALYIAGGGVNEPSCNHKVRRRTQITRPGHDARPRGSRTSIGQRSLSLALTDDWHL